MRFTSGASGSFGRAGGTPRRRWQPSQVPGPLCRIGELELDVRVLGVAAAILRCTSTAFEDACWASAAASWYSLESSPLTTRDRVRSSVLPSSWMRPVRSRSGVRYAARSCDLRALLCLASLREVEVAELAECVDVLRPERDELLERLLDRAVRVPVRLLRGRQVAEGLGSVGFSETRFSASDTEERRSLHPLEDVADADPARADAEADEAEPKTSARRPTSPGGAGGGRTWCPRSRLRAAA